MKIEFPFEIGQLIWTHTLADGEWVTVPAKVKSYSVDEFGVNITIDWAGGTEEHDISYGGFTVDEEQVRNQYLFADRNELLDFLKEN